MLYHIASQCRNTCVLVPLKLSWVCFGAMVIFGIVSYIHVTCTDIQQRFVSFHLWFSCFCSLLENTHAHTHIHMILFCIHFCHSSHVIRNSMRIFSFSFSLKHTRTHAGTVSIFNSCDCAKAFMYIKNGTTQWITTTPLPLAASTSNNTTTLNAYYTL